MNKFQKLILTITISLIFNVHAFCQENKEIIIVPKGLFETKYYYNDKAISHKRLVQILDANGDTDNELEKANICKVFSFITGYAGGFMVGYYGGTAAWGQKIDDNIFAGGIALIACAFPFEMYYQKHVRRATSIYNDGFKKTSGIKWKGNFYIAANSIGFTITY